jgi:hypothetical protein
MGRAELTQVKSGSSSYVRTLREIRQASSDDYLICLMTYGKKHFKQAGREVDLTPGDLCFIDTVKPYELECPTYYEATLLKIPRQEFSARLPLAERYAGMRVPAEGQYAQLAATMIKSTADLFRRNKLEMAFRVVTPLVDLLAVAFDESYASVETDRSRYKG